MANELTMPNTREKLIALLCQATFGVNKQTLEDKLTPSAIDEIADHLIANGVTVQKWIPVTERLPEEDTTILVCGEDGVEPGCFSSKSGFWTCDLYESDPIFGVTHWMPLPQPPKGE